MRDERGVAMTEYLLVTGIMVPLAAYLFHPDNGLYQAFRSEYDLTTTLLMYPGP
jgi:Flp pilus assembly pilin Flp